MNRILHQRSWMVAFLLLFALGARAQTPTYFNNNTASPSNSFPWATAAGKGIQNFFPANSFPSAYPGLITKVYYKVTPNVTTTYTNLEIKLGQTSNSTLATGTIDNTVAFTTVYTAASATLTSNSSGWLEITLQTPFLYNPSQALVSYVFNCSASGTGMSTANFSSGVTYGRTYMNNSGCSPVYSGQDASTCAFGFDLIPASPCTLPINPGTASVSNANPCMGQSITFNLSGNSLGSGQTYQWEFATNTSGTWTAIDTPAITPFLATTANVTAYYRAKVKCSSDSAYSDTVLVTVPAAFPGGTYTIDPSQPAVPTFKALLLLPVL